VHCANRRVSGLSLIIGSVDTCRLWFTYADHLAMLFRGASSLIEERGDTWFAVLTRERHTDVNQCVLTPGASAVDAERVTSLIGGADVPAVVSVTSEADEEVEARLRGAELRPAPLPEPLMWCQTRPAVERGPFTVERVRTKADLRRAVAICAEGHAIDQAILTRVLARDPGREHAVSTWIAWERDEPISVVWLTHGHRIGVWEMMTPPAHRRRGAARAVLTAALAQSWRPSVSGAFLWATPAGRPLYESLGFCAVDEPTIWVTPGGEAGNLAVGQPG
jgi:GNAT superfamily N-acetyltransferase